MHPFESYYLANMLQKESHHDNMAKTFKEVVFIYRTNFIGISCDYETKSFIVGLHSGPEPPQYLDKIHFLKFQKMCNCLYIYKEELPHHAKTPEL